MRLRHVSDNKLLHIFTHILDGFMFLNASCKLVLIQIIEIRRNQWN